MHNYGSSAVSKPRAVYTVHPSSLNGTITIPASKSHTLRAILFAALAEGTSHIQEFLPSPDTTAMIEAVRQLGATVKIFDNELIITGVNGHPQVPDDIIQCGNSGLVLRLIGALAGLMPHYIVLTGDTSIRTSRPAQPLLDGLMQLGCFAVSSRGDGYAPLLLRGPFTKRSATIDGQDSQPVSGLLIAAAFAPHPTELHVSNPGETPWIDLTLNWLKQMGIRCRATGYTHYRLEGQARIRRLFYRVPGDFSTAAFPLAAALLTGSELTLRNLDMADIQGDKALIPILQQMGAKLRIDTAQRTVIVEKGSQLKGARIDVNGLIDALPILAVIGCFATGRTELVNGSIARRKESDRIATIARELRKMGADIEEQSDGLTISPSQLRGAEVSSCHDHRIALSLAVAALAARGSSQISETACIAKSYPSFCKDFQAIGAKIA